MEGTNYIARFAIGLLILSAIALTGLSAFQYQKLRKLSQGVNLQAAVGVKPQAVASEPAVTVKPPVSEAVPVGAEDEDIEAVKEELAAVEEELEKANEKLSEVTARKEEKKNKDKERQRNLLRLSFNELYSSLFEDLNLNHDKIEKFKDLLVDKGMAMRATYPEDGFTRERTLEEKAAIKVQTDKVKDEYEAKFKELLRREDYEKYTAYNERSGSRSNVTAFKQTLVLEEQLTKEQEKELVEIWYNNQEKLYNEMIRNQEGPPDGSNTAEYDLNKEAAYLKIMEDAKDTLSASQLERLKDYLKNQSNMMELSAKMSDQQGQ